MPEDDIIDPTDVPDPEAGAEAPPEFSLPDDFASQVQSWEIDPAEIAEAVKTYKALQTEDGVIDTFIATGQSLGFGLKELNMLLQDEPPAAPPAAPAAPAPAADEADPTDLMTRAEVAEMLRREAAAQSEAFQRQQAEREEAAKKQAVFSAIDTWFDGHEIKDPTTRRQIAAFAEKHVLPTQDSYDPKVALAALEIGAKEYDAWVQAEAAAHLARKAATASEQPTPVGGGQGATAGADDDREDYAAHGRSALQVAKAKVRERLRANGDLD